MSQCDTSSLGLQVQNSVFGWTQPGQPHQDTTAVQGRSQAMFFLPSPCHMLCIDYQAKAEWCSPPGAGTAGPGSARAGQPGASMCQVADGAARWQLLSAGSAASAAASNPLPCPGHRPDQQDVIAI